MVRRMRVSPLARLALGLLLSACGGAGGAGGADRVPKAPLADNSDPAFADYAATHGIQTLNGGGGDAPEVTADGLRLELVAKDKPVKLDGILLEWPAPAKASVLVKGSAAKTSMKIALQYDDAKLYVGVDVADESFVAGRDHVSLVLAIPQPGGAYAAYDLAFFAGKPGESEGSVRYGRRGAVAGAKIVEASAGSGYTFEAAVPWGALPEARTTRVGIHGVARYFDGENVIATGPGDGQHPSDRRTSAARGFSSATSRASSRSSRCATSPVAAGRTSSSAGARAWVTDRASTSRC